MERGAPGLGPLGDGGQLLGGHGPYGVDGGADAHVVVVLGVAVGEGGDPVRPGVRGAVGEADLVVLRGLPPRRLEMPEER